MTTGPGPRDFAAMRRRFAVRAARSVAHHLLARLAIVDEETDLRATLAEAAKTLAELADTVDTS